MAEQSHLRLSEGDTEMFKHTSVLVPYVLIHVLIGRLATKTQVSGRKVDASMKVPLMRNMMLSSSSEGKLTPCAALYF